VCGRFTQQRPTSELAEIFEAADLAADGGGHFNVAPTDEAAVVVQREEQRAIVRYRWGLIPPWAPDAKIASRTINARAETVASMPAFRDALRRRRCLVPVDGFYEWRREGAQRQPYRIERSDGRPLVLAGLWAGWRDPAARGDQPTDIRRTFTIVTTRANTAIEPLHDRMPVVLPDGAWSRWLDTRSTDVGELHGLLVPAEDIGLSIYPVVPLVNNVRNNGPELLDRLA
jgi:putative SOS response-associated peptidase YedK